MRKTIVYESQYPAEFEDSTKGKSGAILGKLKVPFFDMKNPTRNGRDYTEAAEDALNSDSFKEKIENRVFFGRLGHPVTEEECAEDPAVRACVVMTDYDFNKNTNMYEGTLEILNNQYGKQLKSLIDAGCVMGASTRGSGDSYTEGDREVITKGTYDFEALDIVTMPAVKRARVSVMESLDSSKKKSLESIISDANDKTLLEGLKVTIGSSNMANKDKLLEMIDGKLGKEEVGTIESLTNDIVMITKKYDEALKRIEELESKSSGTTGIEKVFGLLKESASVVSDLKSKFLSVKGELSEATSKLETLQVENNGLAIANKRLDESLTAITKERDEYKSKFESVSSESKTESSNSAKLNESLDNSKKLNEELKKDNSTLTESLNSLRNKYVKVVAEAYGVSYEQLKLQSGSNPAPDKVESLAKSMRENDDRKRYMVPDLFELGNKIKNESLDRIESGCDPELDRAGRIASLTK